MHGMLLPVEGHHLHTVDLGQGTPLVLHSGWVASWGLWLPLVERLQTRWRCVALSSLVTPALDLPIWRDHRVPLLRRCGHLKRRASREMPVGADMHAVDHCDSRIHDRTFRGPGPPGQ